MIMSHCYLFMNNIWSVLSGNIKTEIVGLLVMQMIWEDNMEYSHRDREGVELWSKSLLALEWGLYKTLYVNSLI